jgi:hypothetical protein
LAPTVGSAAFIFREKWSLVEKKWFYKIKVKLPFGGEYEKGFIDSKNQNYIT